jgi:hypothetical protein
MLGGVAAAVALVLALVVAVALGRRVRVRAEAQASVDEELAWTAGGGAQCGPLSIAVAARSGRAPVVAVHLFGRRIARVRPRLRTAVPGEARKQRGSRRPRISAALAALESMALHTRFDVFDVHVRGGAPDPAVVGPAAALLSAASGALAPWARVTHEIDWLAESTHAELHARVELAVSPARVAMVLLRFARPSAWNKPTLAAASAAV